MSGPHRRVLLPGIDALGPAARFTAFGGGSSGGDSSDGGVTTPTLAEWRAEAAQIVVENASGLALRRLADGGGERPQARVWEAMTHAHRRASMDALGYAAMTLPFLDTLDRRGIPAVVIKGLAVSRHYPASEMRPFRDVDIVVPPLQFADAMLIARSCGLATSEHDLQPHAWFDVRCREGVNLAGGNGRIRLDLHHHVSPWAFSRHLDFARLAAQSEETVVHGHRIRVASPTHSLAVALLHLISEQWQKKLSVVTWSDVAVLADVVGATNAAHCAEEFRAIRLDWLLADTLAQLPVRPTRQRLASALGNPRIPLGQGVRLRLLDDRSLVGRHPISWAARLPIAQAAWFVGGSLVPSRQYLQARFGAGAGYLTWWSTAWRWAGRALRGHDVSSPYSKGRDAP